MNCRLKWGRPLPEEYRHVASGHGAYLLVRIEPGDLETEGISIVLLRAFNISDRELRHWRGNRRQWPFGSHVALAAIRHPSDRNTYLVILSRKHIDNDGRQLARQSLNRLILQSL